MMGSAFHGYQTILEEKLNTKVPSMNLGVSSGIIIVLES